MRKEREIAESSRRWQTLWFWVAPMAIFVVVPLIYESPTASGLVLFSGLFIMWFVYGLKYTLFLLLCRKILDGAFDKRRYLVLALLILTAVITISLDAHLYVMGNKPGVGLGGLGRLFDMLFTPIIMFVGLCVAAAISARGTAKALRESQNQSDEIGDGLL